jgi:hypothetical protein
MNVYKAKIRIDYSSNIVLYVYIVRLFLGQRHVIWDF